MFGRVLAVALAATADVEGRLTPILERIRSGMTLTADSDIVPLQFTGATFVADSLQAIRNPLTPQMATLRWRIPATPAARLDVSLDQSFGTLPGPAWSESTARARELPFAFC